MRSLAVLLLVFSACSQANTPPEIAEKFLLALAVDSAKATDDLLVGSELEKQPQAVFAMKTQLATIKPMYGKPLGIERVLDQEISPSLRRLVYIQKYQSLPMAWEFYFYRAGKFWVVTEFNSKDRASLIVGGIK
jgi:hypothetical protein